MRILPVLVGLVAAAMAGAVSTHSPPPPPSAVAAVSPPIAAAPSPGTISPTCIDSPAVAVRVPEGDPAPDRIPREPTPPTRRCIEGIVLDEHGAPLDEFEIVPAVTYTVARGVRLGGGEFTFVLGRQDGIAPGRFRPVLFTVRAPGRVPAEICPSREEFETLRRGEVVSGLEVVLRPAAKITGRVIGPDGEPVSHAVVRAAREQDLLETTWGYFELTDDEGRFEIDDLDPALRLHLIARDGAKLVSDALWLQSVLGDARRAEVELVLRHRDRVTLEVATAGLAATTRLTLDGRVFAFEEPVARVGTRTGTHLLRAEREDGRCVTVRIEIPEGLAVYSLELTARASEETCRADPPR